MNRKKILGQSPSQVSFLDLVPGSLGILFSNIPTVEVVVMQPRREQ